MGKKIEKVNHRVEIEPEIWGNDTDDKFRAACTGIVNDVKRHVDGIRSIDYFWDTKITCEHCGSTWEEDPWCCDKARAEIDAAEAPDD